MDIEELREFYLSLPGASEGAPFGEDVLVFYVLNKMFALVALERFPLAVNLKCDPTRAAKLREQYASVAPGYHMDKRHWNTVTLDGSLSDALMRELVMHSYELVVSKLPRSQRAALEAMS